MGARGVQAAVVHSGWNRLYVKSLCQIVCGVGVYVPLIVVMPVCEMSKCMYVYSVEYSELNVCKCVRYIVCWCSKFVCTYLPRADLALEKV